MSPTHKLARPNGRNKTNEPIKISNIINPAPTISQISGFSKKDMSINSLDYL